MAIRFKQPPAAFNIIATLVTFAAAVGLSWMAWSYYEYTPWTRDGRVRVYTVPLAPEVSGTVVSLPIKDDQFVHKGDLLFQIDPRTYQNDVKQAEGRLAAAKAQASYQTADAKREAALTDLAASAQQKQDTGGVAASANANVIQAEGALDQAKLNLERSHVVSPVNGWVTNLLLQSGGFASTGQAALTLVDADSFWIEGYFEETQLPRIGVGDEARAVLMGFPGVTITGRVEGVGRGISVSDAAPGVQGLPSVNPVFTWVRLAQRVPIRVRLDDVPCPIVLSAGLTASVSILGRPTDVGDKSKERPSRTGSDTAQTCTDQGNAYVSQTAQSRGR